MDGYSMEPQRTVLDMDASQRLIIYCMGALDKPVKDEVNIQKIIFLSAMSYPGIFRDMYTFRKHKKGPYSEKIDEDLNVISNSGLVKGSDFDLSKDGRRIYKQIEAGVKEPLRSAIPENKEFVSDLSQDELLTFVYTAFPEFIENSEVWEKLESHRMKHAVSMLKKEKITASMAADIAGMDYFEFEDLLKKQGIRWKS